MTEEDDITLTREEIEMFRWIFARVLPVSFLFIFWDNGQHWNYFPVLLSLMGYAYFTLLSILSQD